MATISLDGLIASKTTPNVPSPKVLLILYFYMNVQVLQSKRIQEYFDSQYQINSISSVKMKKTKQPSPRSSHARKPLVNITNITNIKSYSSVDSKQRHNELVINLQDKKLSSCNSSSRCETPVERIRAKKNNTQSKQKQLSEFKGSSQKVRRCVNHPNREAKHEIDIGQKNLYCLQCAFYYAKQGYKVSLVEKSGKGKDRENRMQEEGRKYLKKCESICEQISEYKQEWKMREHKMEREKEIKLGAEKQRLENEVKRLTQRYEQQKERILLVYNQQIQRIRQKEQNIKSIQKTVLSTAVDIENNIETLDKKIEESQFRVIMDKYWNKLNEIRQYLRENLCVPLIESFKVEEEKGNQNEFTFSKKERVETPPNKIFEKVRLANSEGETNNNSSMRDSVVDMKFNFQ